MRELATTLPMRNRIETVDARQHGVLRHTIDLHSRQHRATRLHIGNTGYASDGIDQVGVNSRGSHRCRHRIAFPEFGDGDLLQDQPGHQHHAGTGSAEGHCQHDQERAPLVTAKLGSNSRHRELGITTSIDRAAVAQLNRSQRLRPSIRIVTGRHYGLAIAGQVREQVEDRACVL